MSLTGPPPLVRHNPPRRIAQDVRDERALNRRGVPLPPGDTNFSLPRTFAFAREPLPILLDLYERFGPVFTIRILHTPQIFVLGPEANHHLLLGNPENYSWREGGFSELLPLLGDGLLNIDGAFHRSSRKIMLPAFHRERIAGALELIQDETERAIAPWRAGMTVDLHHWTRGLALRVAMRALFGLDPDASRRDLDATAEFEHALSFYGKDYLVQMLRGPRTPWARMQHARAQLDRLIFGEIERRRRTGERGTDIMSLLLDAEDDEGSRLSDKHVRDEVMTLLFAGHDTTTATICFLHYELARNPEARATLLAERGALEADRPDYPTLMAGGLPQLDMAIDETLRLWPPAWIGPRRAIAQDEIVGVPIPARAYVNYSSWVSHRLPDVWDEPDAFRPERFTETAKAEIPKGAYVPFGGGSRTCIGMRFGQLEIKAIASRILREFTLELQPGWTMDITQTPTIGPRAEMPVVIRAAP